MLGPVVKPLLAGIEQAMGYELENGVSVAAVNILGWKGPKTAIKTIKSAAKLFGKDGEYPWGRST